jgi:hypothetical protein
VNPRHSRGKVNGFTLHASRFTLHASCFTNLHHQDSSADSQAVPSLAQSSQTSPTQASQGMACLSTSLLSAQHQAYLQHTHQSTPAPESVAAHSHLPANFLFSSTTFANAQHSKFPEDIHPCYRPPQYYKRLSISVRISWQRPIEPTPCTEAITSGPRTTVSPFNKNVDISAQVLNARSPFLQKLHNNRFLTTPEQARPRRPRPAVQAHDPGILNIEPSRLGLAECGAVDSHITTPCVLAACKSSRRSRGRRVCCPRSFLS